MSEGGSESCELSGIRTLQELEDLFAVLGVERVFLKKLAAKQDNEKNQIYLASGGEANSILNSFSAELCYRSPSTSTNKRVNAGVIPVRSPG